MNRFASQTAAITAYGGSDVALPSFNRPRYVRYTSINSPRDFGRIENIQLDLEGVVGAESGSQSLFFAFETSKPFRIRLRRTLFNRYTDQYITISLSGETGPVALEIDGSGNSFSSLPALELGYVACGYWATGYCEADCQRSPNFAAPAEEAVTDSSTSEVSSPLAGVLPAGAYHIVVSSTEWPQLPYRFQASVSLPGELSGVLDLQDVSIGRLALARLTGIAEARSAPVGGLVRELKLNGAATTEARPAGTIEVISPYGLRKG